MKTIMIIKHVSLYILVSFAYVLISCSSQPDVYQRLEENGYRLELQDNQFCDAGISKHYLIYNDNDIQVAYIYEFDSLDHMNDFLDDNPTIEDKQIFDRVIIFAENDLLSQLND